MLSLSRERLHSVATTLYNPFSSAALPLATGITRRVLQLQGVVMQEARLLDTTIGWYYGSSLAAPDQEVPIVLVHGITANAITWGLQLHLLRSAGPVYAVDLPGFGLSGYPPGKRYTNVAEQCDYIETFIREVVGRPALVAGYSLGGWLAVRLAWDVPELIAGIIIMNAGGAWLNGPESWLPFVETFRMRNLQVVRQVYQDMFGSHLVRGLLYLGQNSFQELFHRDPVQPFFASVQAEDFMQPDDVRHLPVPAGLIWGADDRFLPAGSFEFFRDNLPDTSPMLLLSHCGHLPMWDRPWSVAAFIKQFARQLASRRVAAPVQP